MMPLLTELGNDFFGRSFYNDISLPGFIVIHFFAFLYLQSVLTSPSGRLTLAAAQNPIQ
jgi:hypothetical protein